MPAPKPAEFRRRAVELARRRDKPIAELAKDLGIAEWCLRNWLRQAEVDGRAAGGAEQRRTQRAGRAAPAEPGAGDGGGNPQAGQRLLRPRERAPKMIYPVVGQLAADDIPVAVTCRVLRLRHPPDAAADRGDCGSRRTGRRPPGRPSSTGKYLTPARHNTEPRDQTCASCGLRLP